MFSEGRRKLTRIRQTKQWRLCTRMSKETKLSTNWQPILVKEAFAVSEQDVWYVNDWNFDDSNLLSPLG